MTRSRNRISSPLARREAGKRLRERVPRQAHARCVKADEGPGRLAPLWGAERGRVPALLPEKYKRMSVSPFAFFRGSAPLMASDLARLPCTGAAVQICGDAHVRNLGAYEALDGALVFDINDFDETIRGPWEWDVKRMAASLVLAGTEAGLSSRRAADAVRLFVESYRTHLRHFAKMRYTALARYLITRRPGNPLLDALFRDARRVTPKQNLRKLAVERRGAFRFHDRRPDLEHVPPAEARAVVHALRAYAATLNASRRWTFERYCPEDVAFKIVGTGSVGTRDYVVLLFGNGSGDPLFLQVKQELPSCYVPYMRSASPFAHDGQRVANGQQLMQTLSDSLLGYTRVAGRDYLVRQLADHKAAVDPAALTHDTLLEYARLCGEALAKGHARSGDAALLAGYAGKTPKLDDAIAQFAVAYAEQVERDYGLFLKTRRVRRRC